MRCSQYDISLLLENMVIVLSAQSGSEKEELIRELFRSEFYSALVSGEVDLQGLSVEEAVERFKAEGVRA